MDFLESEEPDIICLQEVKAERDQVDEVFKDYDVHWNHALSKKGYSGTAILSKLKPISVHLGFDHPFFSGQQNINDLEGRIITAEYEKFFLVTVYTPNSGRDLSRLQYRELEWDPLFLSYLKALEKEKDVVFCGDLNVAHKEIDLANPKTNKKNAGFTLEERQGFQNIVEHGFVDTYRHFYPDKLGAYSWWSYRAGARERNIGWRLDYFCVSASFLDSVKQAEILPEVLGSDHCPVSLTIDI